MRSTKPLVLFTRSKFSLKIGSHLESATSPQISCGALKRCRVACFRTLPPMSRMSSRWPMARQHATTEQEVNAVASPGSLLSV